MEKQEIVADLISATKNSQNFIQQIADQKPCL